ncbi:D-glycero-beta-D-manno-heptose 1,7-bisphosphate 7-phosphatase [Candidatus Erwinia haradaeae]|uniref:D-glycero-beta-D-manno-heptose 1,7-bisphosphate 7-phosphatase n=1 Tax=Candidatus Erwinia haradaeae TaxID=1922217 RepID=UPI001300435A|nr:D-glycero-beta-D-manno-heptose 1,7-bisphosphate 7-phosphatase [Candidatus Erwinia haradaeae]
MVYKTPAIFLDRDGTINLDFGYVCTIDRFKFIDGVIDAMHELILMGFAIIVVTNQSGIARGIFTINQFMILTQWMNKCLAEHNIRLDGVYFCPHHPTATIKKWRKKCHCRKPQPGMLLTAKKDLHIKMSASYMVGDKIEDIKAAQTAGVGKKILVRSGQVIHKEHVLNADYVLNSLKELPQYIKKTL